MSVMLLNDSQEVFNVKYNVLLFLCRSVDSLPRKFYKDGDWDDGDEVKDGQFVHFLSYTSLPAL